MGVETAVPAKKQVESSEIQIGSCKFCGQSYQIETSGVCSQERLDEWATEKCDCGDAKEEKKRKEQEIKAELNIEILFGGGRRGGEDPEGSSPSGSGMYSGFRDSQYRQRGKRDDKADE